MKWSASSLKNIYLFKVNRRRREERLDVYITFGDRMLMSNVWPTAHTQKLKDYNMPGHVLVQSILRICGGVAECHFKNTYINK